MKKRCLAVMLAGAMVLSALTGCSGSKKISNDNITISQYKEIEVQKVATEKVTDEEVESNVKSALSANRIENEVTDRAVQEGDVVVIDYVGKLDGTAFDGGTANDQELEIGSNSYIEGFESGLIGHNTGETVDLNLTFPEAYQNAEMAGKAVVFTVTIKKIKSVTLPELNDEFVKSVSGTSKTVEEYKKEIRENLETQNKENADVKLQNEAWNAVLANTEVKKYPKDEVEKETKNLKSMYEQLAQYNGMELKDFLEKSMNGMSEEDFDKQAEEAAKETIKGNMAAELIAEKEKLTPDEKEYKKELEQYAKDYGYESVDAMTEAIDEELLKNDVLMTRVKKWLGENCKQVDEVKDSKDDAKSATDTKTEE